MIELKNIVKKYKSQTVLEIENLRFNEDEFVAIFAVGLIASSLPLIVNTRRSPLKNLRSE